ncbi:hypothetical protein ACHWQZ_G019206 [Mnemiopsis leidyi]
MNTLVEGDEQLETWNVTRPSKETTPNAPKGLDPQKREMLEARFVGKNSSPLQPAMPPRKLDSDSKSLGLHEFSDNSVSQDGVLSPAGAVVDRKRRRLEMDGVKSPGNRSGRKISEYFKSNNPQLDNVNGSSRKPEPVLVYSDSQDGAGANNGRPGMHPQDSMFMRAGGSSANDSNSSFHSNTSCTLDSSCQTVVTAGDLRRLEESRMPPPSESSQLVVELRRTIENLQNQYKQRETEFTRELEQERHRYSECQKELKTLLLEKVERFSKESRERCNNNKLRLGQYNTVRSGAHYQEDWVNGYAFREHKQRVERFKQNKESLENGQKLLRQKRKMMNGPTPKKENKRAPTDATPVIDQQELHEMEEILKIKAAALKKEELDIQTEIEKLQQECQLHMRESKRIQAENNSRFKDNPTLKNGRYLLLHLIGKGGFSEVHKAYDFDGQRYVACKVHQLASEWKDEKRANYLKHAVREYDIQKSLNHPHIVSLYDVFEIDQMSFCTVLEFCDGNDLDFYLKQHKSVREQEARCIIMQIVSALRYLNLKKNPVIHYDLKPGNILLVGKGDFIGSLKITDFGLSKIMENSHDGGMELTSQGAGTYWYLPPECFTESPKISSKVDVWSIGVIFYQCLYGKKPFGNNMAQDAILKFNTILKAKEVEFPVSPKISQEAKTFIRKCLSYRADLRVDVLQLSEDPYLKQPPKRTKSEKMHPPVQQEAPPSPIPQSLGTFLPPVVTSSHS